jgi:predicted NACHT family NTPase
VVLLFDGLDEVTTPHSGTSSLRARVSRAVQALAITLPLTTRVVVTSRVLPYMAAPTAPHADWRLPLDEGWQRRWIAPLALGQVAQFIQHWYQATSHEAGASYDTVIGAQRAKQLLTQLRAPSNARLRDLVQSPLLLTMLAILHYNTTVTGELPRDRERLYDEFVQLLLERREPRRQPGIKTKG